ncbi:uncharacterized protein LOC105211184 [Zeugodacus cucurbitae]|uniref:Eukaryotic translation initiation factor 3 subunit C n=1 Tax=Zeugodacus cucurbitae TaxID=28588 RepID=A0A0A1X4B4_ZEUCU|nr:uncharacterized protein LOC105211184 [Zeugodacus cucurbitae]
MTLLRKFGNQLCQGFKTPLLTGRLARTMASQDKRPEYRSQCAWGDPKCAEDKLKEKKDKDECDKKDKPKTSMWLNRKCYLGSCQDALPRFDDLYYKPSDKVKRQYTRTWNECPDLKIVPRKTRLDLTKIEKSL